MAVAYVSNGTRQQTAGATTLTPTLPGSRVNGYLLLAVRMSKDGSTHTCADATWWKIGQYTSGSAQSVSLWLRVVNGSEAAPAIVSGNSPGSAIIFMLSRPDFDNANLSDIVGAISANSGSGTTHSSTGAVTTEDGARVFYVDCGNANTAIATPSGWTEHYDNGNATGASRNAIGSKAVATAGTSAGNISIVGASGAWNQIQIEILDAVLPGDVYSIGSDADDVSMGVDATWLPSGVLLQGANNSGTGLGVRFTGVAVPQGATINSANLVLLTYGSGRTGTQWGAIYGDDVDNAAAWSSGNNPLTITKTSASVAVKGSNVDRSPLIHDVTAIVQELVDRAGWSSGNAMRFGGDPTGANGNMRFWDYSLDPANVARLYIEVDAGGAVSITPASTVHINAASSPTLAAKSTVSPNSAANLHTSSSPSISAKSSASPSSAYHINAASSPSLAAKSMVAPDSSAHVQTASSPTVGTPVPIAPDDSAHLSDASSPTIAAQSSVVANNATHAHTATSPPLSTANSVSADSTAHLSSASSPSIAAASSVEPDDAAHILASTSPTITAASTVSPDSSAQATASTSPSLAAVYPITPDSAVHLITSTQPTITLAGAIAPDGAMHDTAANSPAVSAHSSVSVDSASHETDASEPSLSGSVTIAPASAFHRHIAGSPSIAWTGSVAANDAAHSTSASEPSLSARASVAPESAFHDQSATSPTLSTTTSVLPASAAHLVVAGVPNIRITMPAAARRTSATDYVDRGAMSEKLNRNASATQASRNQVTAVSNRTAVSVRSAR